MVHRISPVRTGALAAVLLASVYVAVSFIGFGGPGS
jgi:hypothetical protein